MSGWKRKLSTLVKDNTIAGWNRGGIAAAAEVRQGVDVSIDLGRLGLSVRVDIVGKIPSVPVPMPTPGLLSRSRTLLV